MNINIQKFMITVDRGMLLSQMIDLGRYNHCDRRHDFTSSNFPIFGTDKLSLEVELWHFDQYIYSRVAQQRTRDEGYCSGRIEHLLALGSEHPDLQREFPITALGSRCSVIKARAAVLSGGHSSRNLELGWCIDEKSDPTCSAWSLSSTSTSLIGSPMFRYLVYKDLLGNKGQQNRTKATGYHSHHH